jgi:hypothetical protein
LRFRHPRCDRFATRQTAAWLCAQAAILLAFKTKHPARQTGRSNDDEVDWSALPGVGAEHDRET